MANQESSKRQVAHKVRVADVVNNRYVKEDGWLPNYIAVGDLKVSRANLLGVIVSKSAQETDVVSQNFVLDDGSGRVSLRFFEPAGLFDVGDIVNVIGRPREFGAERYIVPEIMKKVKDPKWVELRRLELAMGERSRISAKTEPLPAREELAVETEEVIEDSSPSARFLDVLRELDRGDGVGFEDLTSRIGGDLESVAKRLLEQGDIFEVKPGRYKVLE